MSYSSLIVTLKAINSHIHVTSSPPSIVFPEGYYDGNVEIDIVESLLSAHGFRGIPRVKSVRIDDRTEETVLDRPVAKREGEFHIWPTYRMMIEEIET